MEEFLTEWMGSLIKISGILFAGLLMVFWADITSEKDCSWLKLFCQAVIPFSLKQPE